MVKYSQLRKLAALAALIPLLLSLPPARAFDEPTAEGPASPLFVNGSERAKTPAQPAAGGTEPTTAAQEPSEKTGTTEETPVDAAEAAQPAAGLVPCVACLALCAFATQALKLHLVLAESFAGVHGRDLPATPQGAWGDAAVGVDRRSLVTNQPALCASCQTCSSPGIFRSVNGRLTMREWPWVVSSASMKPYPGAIWGK